jgi:uncharacterized membrane protein
MTLRHWLSVAAAAALTGAWSYVSTHLGDGIPSSSQQWTALVVGALVGALGAIVHLYQSSPPDLSKIRALQAAARAAVVLLALWLFGASITACPQAVGAVVPALDCGVAIVEDAVSGMSVLEIAAKENARCGADAMAIIDVLLSSRDPRLAGTKALGEARAARGLK